MSDKPKIEGLPLEFIKTVCWAGNDISKWCRYVRAYKGVHVCAKGTAAGIRHSQRLARWQERIEGPPTEVVFDSGEKTPEDDKPRMRVLAGDNCPGRAAEFAHLFDDEKE
jgi:hypothetical protein